MVCYRTKGRVRQYHSSKPHELAAINFDLEAGKILPLHSSSLRFDLGTNNFRSGTPLQLEHQAGLCLCLRLLPRPEICISRHRFTPRALLIA